MTSKERARACLLGGALGDALGAPLEFLSWSQIQAKYGPLGIQELGVAYGRVGAITDDTQMTLFTAEGLIRSWVRSSLKGTCHVPTVVGYSYQRWLNTQGERPHSFALEAEGWLHGHRDLHHRRAPGTTCLSALRGWKNTDMVARNDSKGCGTVMRSAPFGFFPGSKELAEECSDLTHGHVEARASAGALAQMIEGLVAGRPILESVQSAAEALHKETITRRLLLQAVSLAKGGADPIKAIPSLGEGWVAEEALAIGVFCALRGQEDFKDAIRMAVNHSGDSDSTGSICGNLLGAAFGMSAIPRDWLDQLELKDVIDQVAQDMVGVREGRAEDFEEKYPGA